MKQLTLIFLFFCSVAAIKAQSSALEVFTTDAQKFKLFVDGNAINAAPLPRVSLDNLSAGRHQIQIIFQSVVCQSLAAEIPLQPGYKLTLSLKQSSKTPQLITYELFQNSNVLIQPDAMKETPAPAEVAKAKGNYVNKSPISMNVEFERNSSDNLDLTRREIEKTNTKVANASPNIISVYDGSGNVFNAIETNGKITSATNNNPLGVSTPIANEVPAVSTPVVTPAITRPNVVTPALSKPIVVAPAISTPIKETIKAPRVNANVTPALSEPINSNISKPLSSPVSSPLDNKPAVSSTISKPTPALDLDQPAEIQSTVKNSATADCVKATADEYLSMIRQISAYDTEEERLIKAQQVVTGVCVSSRQIGNIMQLMETEGSRLEFAQYSYVFCFDKANYGIVNNAFLLPGSANALSIALGL